MATVSPTTTTEELRERILAAVQDMYTEVAAHPSHQFHFPTGRPACAFVGYPAAELELIPTAALESFAGVGYPFQANIIRPGQRVLDIGSGAGTDVILAALKVGPAGRVSGLDMTEAMIRKARENIAAAGIRNAEILEGQADAIPLPDAVIDVVTSNGVLNLVHDKRTAFREIFRVLRPGGGIQISDIVLGRDLSPKSRENPQLWAECIVGAVGEEDCLQMMRSTGFQDVRVLDRIDYFEHSPNAATQKVARQFGAFAITLTAVKPGERP